MNFEDAISAHIKWKVRLSRFIDGTGMETLDSTAVGRDDLCDLGKWIYGEGAKYATLRHYRNLVEEHAKFHRCAGDVVRKVECGDVAGARTALGGAFVAASKDTVAAIMELKREAFKG